MVVVLLGSTMYDSLSNAPVWLRFSQENGLHPAVTGTAGLILVIAAVAVAYLAATVPRPRIGRAGAADTRERAGRARPLHRADRRRVRGRALLLAAVLEGQRTVALLSDPLDTGANWLGTADWDRGPR